MKKNLRELTADFQASCNEGDSNCKVKIQILDGFYDIGDIKKVYSGNEAYYVIEAKIV